MSINNKKVFYIFFIFSIIISSSHFLIDSFYHSISSKEIFLKNGKELVLKKEKDFKLFLENSKATILSIRESNILNSFIKTNEKKIELEDLFLTITKSNSDFMQLRYLDKYGHEIIKIERQSKKDNPKIILEELLQDKSNRDYFKESKNLKDERVWFSKMELNMENNKIQVPYRPTIRTVLPLLLNDEFNGLIIINYFAEDLIKHLVSGVGFKMTLVDELGFIISDSDKTKDWSFYKKEKNNIIKEYPKHGSNILLKNSYITEDFVSKSFDLASFDNMYIILKVDEKALSEQKKSELIQEIFLSFIYFIITMILSFIVYKILQKLFFDLNEQIDIVDRLELATNIANIALWEYNAKTKNVLWSKNIKTILELDCEILYDDFLRMIPKEERDIVEKEFKKSIQEKREYSIIHEMKIKNCRTKILEERGTHFYDSFGNHTKSVGCTYDITEKYLADKLKDKIIKQNKKFERLFNKFDESVIASSTNLSGIITYTSKAFCEISGYSRVELIGSPQNIVRHPDSLSETFSELWETIKAGNIWQGELKNRNKNGSYYWVYAVIYPEYNENDQINGYTAIRQDITPLKELEDLNKNIKSSIEVASFIQESILPTKTFMKSCFRDKFIIWEPKDIVGGDIYLLEELKKDDEYLLMIIDCTGHGVPGAFVTMLIKAIEKQLIQKIISNPEKEVNPAELLQYFNLSLKEILNQEKRNLATNVGFDGGIIYYKKSENIIKYSGAANTLIYYNKNEIKTIKGDRRSIGYKNIDTSYKFKNHEIKVEEGMKFYLFTDGYIDQIGGEKNQSFSRSRMLDIINKNKKESMKFQKEILLKELKDYQKGFERIDDITILAIEI